VTAKKSYGSSSVAEGISGISVTNPRRPSDHIPLGRRCAVLNLRQENKVLACFDPNLILGVACFQKSVILLSRTFSGPCDLNRIGRGQPAWGTMMEHTQIAATPRERFMHAAKSEMARFEREEIEFRKKDREERAAELQIPLSKDNHH
jgi:hypothetical protein